MTTENGALDGGEKANIEKETNNVNDGSTPSTDVTEMEELKKASAGKDSTISKLQKKIEQIDAEREAKELSSKSTEEQLAHVNKTLSEIKEEQVLREKLADSGISYQDAKKIMDGGTVEERAEALSSVLSAHSKQASSQAVEEFKTSFLDKVPKDTPNTADEKQEDAFQRGMKRGASF